MKLCPICKEPKKRPNFGVYCAKCGKLRYRIANREKTAAKELARYHASAEYREAKKEYLKKYRASGKARECNRRWYTKNKAKAIAINKKNMTVEIRNKRRKATDDRYPERALARGAVARALKTGKLLRQPCKICGSTSSEAHHEDYSKKLDVMWLCKPHHHAWHRIFVEELK